MSRHPLRPPLGVLPWVLVTSMACTVGPDPQRPGTIVDEALGYVHAPPTAAVTAADRDAITPWWHGFADEATDRLVEEALVANTDLRAAAARVVEARSQLRAARGARWPEISASASVTETRNSFVLPDIGRVTTDATTYTASLDVAYQVDVFGQLKRSAQAAWADVLAEEAARQTVLHSVIAEVVRARTQISTRRRAAELARDTRDSWSRSLETIDRRFRSGLATALELRLARENLASANAAVVLAEQQEAQARLGLDVLLGRRPGTGPALEALLAPLPEVTPVPLGLPAALLDRRPDLRQAEMRFTAATARVGVAVANLFPRLSLSGTAGANADGLSDLVSSDAFVFNLISNLAAPLFDAGQRRANVVAAEARAEQAAAAYAGTILRALREVEDALIRDNAARDRLTHLEVQVTEARAAKDIAEARYLRGVLPLLQLLESERRLRQAENTLVNAQGDTWGTRVDLFLALGGDWAGHVSAATTDAPSSTTDHHSSATREEDA